MSSLREKFDKNLLDLAWSLWTELGVAGVKRKHQKFLIIPEELVILTAALGDIDPRLRDEALDWCSRNHHFISISRLKTLAKSFDRSIQHSFSKFSATLNSVSSANWPILIKADPLKFIPSKKSKSPPFQLPALLCFRLRELFGVGARADLILFFLSQEKVDFAVSDVTEIGYSKRTLANVLESFTHAGIFNVFMARNQQRYHFAKRNQIIRILDPLPEFMPPWRHIIEVLLSLRACIQHIEDKSESSKVIEIRNTLMGLQNKLNKLKLIAPPFQADLKVYLNVFSEWILRLSGSLAQGDFQ